MGKWYKQGFQDALDGLPIDPPMHPKHRDYVNYSEGFVDGQRQLDLDAEREEHADGAVSKSIRPSPGA